MQKFDDQKIKEILQREGYVVKADLEKAENFARIHKTSIVEYLLTEGLLTKDLLGQAIAESYKVDWVDLEIHKPTKEQILLIPEKLAHEKKVIVAFNEKNTVVVATDDPTQTNLKQDLEKIFPKQKISLAYALTEQITELFTAYKKTLETRFASIIKNQKRIAPEIINEILEDALTFRSSDIHFEPQESEVVIRFRIDGVLHEAGRIPKEFFENILNRIKVQAHLRIDEHFSAQDGAMRYEKDGEIIDMRVSVVPTLEGEKIVIRLLSQYVRGFTLGDLGLSETDHQIFSHASNKPFGMILTTGPTGSGKTTSLYALLKIMNRPEINITTIEDPVEYRVIGVNQIQVNPQAKLTFSTGLRSIVRQDPDVILVGEIRDEETAEIAVNAALTGHLLLSTFHANDAATAIPRLLDMKIQPFLLASTLELIIAQRLVRRICQECRTSISVSKSALDALYTNLSKFFPEKIPNFYKGKGCEACNHTGFAGRSGIFEMIEINQEIQNLILLNPSADQIWQVARKNGTQTLFEDGLEKVKAGVTTIEELLRVAEPPPK